MRVVGNGDHNNGAAAVVQRNGVVDHDPQDFELAMPATTSTVLEEEDERDLSTYNPVKKLPWQWTIWAWFSLAIQGLVMGGLYLNGGGRTARLEYPLDEDGEMNLYEDPTQCFVAEGKPGVAEAVALRAATAVVAQLIIFCVTDLGLLKPHEAMWVIVAYFMKLAAKVAQACFGISLTLPEVKTTHVYTDGTRKTETDRPGALCCCILPLIWILFYTSLIWSFTGFPATLNLMAVCDLVLHGEAITWFKHGSMLFLFACNVVLSCLSDGWEAGSLIPFARVFLVVDSITIGATAVWGNYVQSGVIAGVFALLPLSNTILTGLELTSVLENDVE